MGSANSYLGIAFFLFFSIAISAQVSQINISAQLKDTLGETVPAATVMLLNSRDSTLVNYTTSNSEGYFAFKNIKNHGYILKVSHISFMPIQKPIPVSQTENVNLGVLIVEPIAEILMEVVIKSAQAPLFIRGDTVEYDARLFKIPPGSTVEDLLRRLPGIDVDASGNISTQGKDVKRIYVDGKTFFGDDPTSVTKNLDADAISKVQVYDDKSEQERLTGIGDGNKEKVMNLELKNEYKKGYFGKATIASGTEERYAGRGSFNRFAEKHQLSFIAYGNNINQTGVNWDDYSEFKGNSAYSDRDNGDFGFNIGGHGHGYNMDGMDYFDGKGFTKNYGGGVNYNYFDAKTTFNASYFYNQTDLFYNTYSNRNTFLADTSFFMNDTVKYDEFRNSHKFTSRAEIAFDSSNTVIFRINANISGKDSDMMQNQLFTSGSDFLINQNFINNIDSLNSQSLNGLAIYKHKFNKKGRTFAISGAYNYTQSNSDQNIYNLNKFFAATTLTEQINILNDKSSRTNQIKSSALYVEPLSKKFSLMGFYNFSSNSRISSKLGNDALAGFIMVDTLSVYYKSDELQNRAGASLNYNYEGLNLSLGGAYQTIMMTGSYSTIIDSPLLAPELTKTYSNFIPNFSGSLQLPNNMHFNLSYTYKINAPSIYYLQPVPDYSNRFYKSTGNPDLSPERNHNANLNCYYWNQASFTNVSVGVYYNYYDSKVEYNQTTEFTDGLGYVTYMKPENISGAQNVSAFLWSGFPIIKTVLTMNASALYNNDISPVFVNGIRNITTNNTYQGRLSMNLNIGSRLSFNAGGSANTANIVYSIQTEQNQNILNLNADAGIKWQFAKKSYFEANYDFTFYNNDRFRLDEQMHIVNASVRQIIGKSNKFEIRLAAFDLLNQNKYIKQYPGNNYIQTVISPTLSRYFMLSLSYNIKGFETKLKTERW